MGVTVMEVRRMIPTDLPEVVDLEASNQSPPWNLGIFQEEMDRRDRVYLVAAEPDIVLGFGGVMVAGLDAHITNLLVMPDRRRQGIGSLLMIGLIEEALLRGAKNLTLEVRSKNASALGLYSRFGLAPVGIRADYYDDDDALIMWVHDIDQPEFATRLEGLR